MRLKILGGVAACALALSTSGCSDNHSGSVDHVDAGAQDAGADSSTPALQPDGSLSVDGGTSPDTGTDAGPSVGDASDLGDAQPNGNGGADGATDAGHLVSPVPATTGPVMVSGQFDTAEGPVPMVDGFAYYDPTDSIGAAAPELRIVMTNWPVDTSDPLSVSSSKAAAPGRWWVRFAISRVINPPYHYDLFRGDYFFQDIGKWEQKPTSGFLVDLTSGDDDGGEQVIGTIRITSGPYSDAPTGESFSFRVNHCGILDTPTW